LFEGLILRFKPVNMDVLPLYIVLMGVFPPDDDEPGAESAT
jgi:hypothetical protein